MRSLSSIIILIVLLLFRASSDSPHGDELKISCGDCHTTEGWEIDRSAILFDHATTRFPLEGQHYTLDCRLCHISLVFSKADPECVSCHTDMHDQTVGMDCARCHSPHSWLVQNVTEIHQMSRFPLVGAHITADCRDCHQSASLLHFEPLGVECYDCHMTDYLATSNPDHQLGGFSTHCEECHLMNAFTWTGPSFNHAFFPLTEGHAIDDCRECHVSGEYTGTSRECFSCHEDDFLATTNPNHLITDFSTSCNDCHTIRPGWKPADFREHDVLFPIYSGKHNGEWDNCTSCHTNPSSYSIFSCTVCHEHNKQDMDDEHDDVNGYVYNDMACFDCHPTGDAEEGFNHNLTAFPLTGAHESAECASCHASGYSGTSTYCADCHQADFDQTSNPDHNVIGLSDDCAACHTTLPGWIPAAFAIHNEYYVLSGAHASISTECLTCHNGNYNTTPNTCSGCHMGDYNQSANPNHNALGLPDQCETCHTTDPDWVPALFPIHSDYYPLTGAHAAVYNSCELCHNGNYSSTPNTCSGCHMGDYNQSANPNHSTLGLPDQCEICHTTDPEWEPALFPMHDDYFPLVGAHALISGNCAECHNGNYNTTPNTCVGCHLDDYNQTTDPPHLSAQFPTDCESCHTQVSWEPSTFNHDAQYFPIYSGKHNGQWNTCADCHTNPANYAVFSCIDCHEHNQPDTDEHHQGVPGYVYNSIACLDCHPNGNQQLQRRY